MSQSKEIVKRAWSLVGPVALACGLAVPAAPALAQATIKVGVLHSLSGTMAISETVLKDVTLMAIEEINAKGGVLGKKLEAVVVAPLRGGPVRGGLGCAGGPGLDRDCDAAGSAPAISVINLVCS